MFQFDMSYIRGVLLFGSYREQIRRANVIRILFMFEGFARIPAVDVSLYFRRSILESRLRDSASELPFYIGKSEARSLGSPFHLGNDVLLNVGLPVLPGYFARRCSGHVVSRATGGLYVIRR